MLQYQTEIVKDTLIDGERITTFKVCFPRIVAEELLRHRSFSFCSSSSRAIPIERMIKQNVGFVPELWRTHQPGMSPIEEADYTPEQIAGFNAIWKAAMNVSVTAAFEFAELGIAKEIANRLLMPFQWITLLVQGNAAAYENFFKLRTTRMAQFEIRKLALFMREAYRDNNPEKDILHLPFVHNTIRLRYGIKVSAAKCARVSFYNEYLEQQTPEKEIALANRLAEDLHLSPFEFQVLSKKEFKKPFEVDDNSDMSGNLNSSKLIQVRKLLERGIKL